MLNSFQTLDTKNLVIFNGTKKISLLVSCSAKTQIKHTRKKNSLSVYQSFKEKKSEIKSKTPLLQKPFLITNSLIVSLLVLHKRKVFRYVKTLNSENI